MASNNELVNKDEQCSAFVPGNDEVETTKGLMDENNDIMQDIDMEDNVEPLASKNESSVGENDEGGEDSEEATPIELQCEEVDMNDPCMDPLEWSVRKVIPIPKQYYWETSPTSPSTSPTTERSTPIDTNTLSKRTKLWHNTVYALGKTLHGAEAAGGVIASFLGINRASRFDYVTSTLTPEQWEQAEKNAQEQKKKRAEYLKELEEEQVMKESRNV